MVDLVPLGGQIKVAVQPLMLDFTNAIILEGCDRGFRGFYAHLRDSDSWSGKLAAAEELKDYSCRRHNSDARRVSEMLIGFCLLGLGQYAAAERAFPAVERGFSGPDMWHTTLISIAVAVCRQRLADRVGVVVNLENALDALNDAISRSASASDRLHYTSQCIPSRAAVTSRRGSACWQQHYEFQRELRGLLQKAVYGVGARA